jgi:hypothetical protein
VYDALAGVALQALPGQVATERRLRMRGFNVTTQRLLFAPFICFILLIPISVLPSAIASSVAAKGYDVVILRGRVMDPETGLDAIRNVGIKICLRLSFKRQWPIR